MANNLPTLHSKSWSGLPSSACLAPCLNTVIPRQKGSRMGYPSHEAPVVVPFRNFNEEMRRPGIWESDQAASSTAHNSGDSLASLYRPPFALMHNGPFKKAKDAAKIQDKWFLVNVQSAKEFSSQMRNCDTWANEAVAQTISSNFIFWYRMTHKKVGRFAPITSWTLFL
ncbi:plant UBX domain-containing protein 7-like [Diospyros lotus]|uniref:plant UBX domain-containing protein 7-like n=1 Tax=Diospyros lotus TaxID=55363 RepID=UPI00224CD32D|nr:plant UBX domain-containing protein 7-like [Diospyros lotus]